MLLPPAESGFQAHWTEFTCCALELFSQAVGQPVVPPGFSQFQSAEWLLSREEIGSA
jgi:hypothetical protein